MAKRPLVFTTATGIRYDEIDKDVIELMLVGFTSSEIAGIMYVTVTAINKRVGKMLKRFEVDGRKEIVRKAIEQRII